MAFRSRADEMMEDIGTAVHHLRAATDPVAMALDTVEPAPASAASASATAAFDRLIATVNLGELVNEVVEVGFTEWRKSEVEGPDGEPETVYEPRVRLARIGVMASTEAQLRAFALYNRFSGNGFGKTDGNDGGDDGPFSAEQMRAIEECVLAVWQQSEPSMTLERLHRGLDLFKIMKLFALFFKRMLPASRQPSSPKNGGAGKNSND